MPSTQQVHGPCAVCNAQSIGFNFGVPTCMACKAFFRRNAVKLGSYEFICPKDGDCPVNYIYRRLCNCCRLAKCFRAGMQKELIRTDAEKEARRQIVEQNRQKKLEGSLKTTTLDLIQSMRLLPTIHNTVSRLSPSDHSLLSNIYNAYESTCISIKYSDYADFPRIKHSSIHTYCNEYSKTHQSLIEFYKHIPEFNQMSIDTKVHLFKNQFGILSHINRPIVHPGVSTNLVVSWKNIFDDHLAHRLLQFIERVQVFTHNPFALKIFLVIAFFTTGNFRSRIDNDIDQIYDGTLRIFATQNVYVELLWKYLLSSSSTELEAIRFFNKLIHLLLYLVDIPILIDNYMDNVPDEIEKMEPFMQCLWLRPNNSENIHLEDSDDV